MKRYTLLTALCLLITLPISAQNIHTWKMGPLTWNDFTPNSAIEKQVSHLEYYMGIESKHKVVDGILYYKPTAYAYTTAEYSWVDTNYLSEELLQYNQCIFDAVECYRRQLDSKLQDSSIFTHGQLLDATMRQLADDVRRIELETQYGTDTAALHRWQNRLKTKLSESTPNPTYGYEDAPFSWAMTLDADFLYTGGQLHDYFRNGGGMSWNFEIGYHRAIFGFGLGIGGSRSKQDTIYTVNPDNELWRSDHLTSLNLYAYCGYSVINRSRLRLTPFVGYGLLGYYCTPDEGSSFGPSNGCFHFGIDYNHIFSNQIDYWGLSRDYYNSEHDKLYLDVRLFGTYNNFNSIIDAPTGFTLNLQIGIGFGIGRAHCK